MAKQAGSDERHEGGAREKLARLGAIPGRQHACEWKRDLLRYSPGIAVWHPVGCRSTFFFLGRWFEGERAAVVRLAGEWVAGCV